MKIMVLGATGFTGRNLVERFVSNGHEVHAVRFQRPEYEHDNVIWHQADMREPDALDFSGIDVVYQAAACSSGCKDTLNTPAVHIANNAVMNSYIIPAVVAAKVKHFIFPSCSVMLPDGHNTEEVEPKVRKEYAGFAWTKIYCEKMCEFYSGLGETRFTVMRNSNIYGAYDKFDLAHSHVFGATITKVMRAKDRITIWGSGNEARDFLHVSDFCNFVEMAIERQTEKFALYNCGSGIATTINNLVEKIVSASGKNLIVDHDLSAPTIPTSLSLDWSKANAELGWSPLIYLDEGIRRTISWWKDNLPV